MFPLIVAMLASSAVEARPDVQIDHIILGTANLDEGIERFEKLTGVRPAFGGRHPGRGTQNALASLGSGRYVEIIAPQPEAAESADLRGLRQLKDLTPIGWAVSTKDVATSVQWLTRAGYETSTPTPGSRLRPDGKTLEWTTFGIVKPRLERAPFFIRWSSASVHPSADSPTGCTLTALNFTVAPGHEEGRLLELLGPGVGAGRGSSVPMEIVLQCPKGRVRFPATMPHDPSAHLSEHEGRNYELIRQIHEPGLGLIQRLRASGLLAPDAEWWVAGPPAILPFAGTWKGLEGVEEFERRLGEAMRYDKVELQRYLVSGDDVAAIFLGEGIARATGRPFRSEIVRLYTFENGKIVRVRNYYDTAAYVAAVRGE